MGVMCFLDCLDLAKVFRKGILFVKVKRWLLWLNKCLLMGGSHSLGSSKLGQFVNLERMVGVVAWSSLDIKSSC